MIFHEVEIEILNVIFNLQQWPTTNNVRGVTTNNGEGAITIPLRIFPKAALLVDRQEKVECLCLA
jgi:hypothetical protein